MCLPIDCVFWVCVCVCFWLLGLAVWVVYICLFGYVCSGLFILWLVTVVWLDFAICCLAGCDCGAFRLNWFGFRFAVLFGLRALNRCCISVNSVVDFDLRLILVYWFSVGSVVIVRFGLFMV